MDHNQEYLSAGSSGGYDHPLSRTESEDTATYTSENAAAAATARASRHAEDILLDADAGHSEHDTTAAQMEEKPGHRWSDWQ